ncbi:tRNA pseudouridine(38-40) synthase TruA [Limnobacter humi]|uniref:tRNA pseudouridine synthase A n=1 Tax=Limnobacter humi TaxID=1778671 RepID=A0ABT1WEB7_9BURK|nr:tRNA pseudouridine(38-40) synthase TruA [Limnobacter humi]MCQ8895861.1 tRNA pseudouridine(38-40) synthase TruA [Limnobacter humi]
MNRVVLGLRYSGHSFEGWQTQTHGNTVQDTLLNALEAICGERPVIHCAGRTDAGVHARQQVVHFDTSVHRPLSAWVKGVNNHLPGTVVVAGAKYLGEPFHARYAAISRMYRYYFYASPVRDPFKTHMTWMHYPLDLLRMQSAAAMLVGTHDFSSFRAAQCQAKSPVKTLHRVSLVECSDHCYVEIHGNAFLHHMVRNIMGALFEIGMHRQPLAWMQTVLSARDRSQGAKTASAAGLTLWEVEYPPEFGIADLFNPAQLDFNP